MNGLITAICLTLANQCPGCPQPTDANATALSQFESLEAAVNRLGEEVRQLATGSGRTPRLVDTHPDDAQTAVVDLADSMVDNLLLTRAYLALGIGELKLIGMAERVGTLTDQRKTRYLRHIEAIQFAIDERILEPQDLRVFRVLQAGANDALRSELKKLAAQSTPACQFVYVNGRVGRHRGFLWCCAK